MFWSANFVVVRELNFLLKEENVTLAQVLETDDILQECKADNKALIQFITKPEILAELITLITEEPSKNVRLANQYRHANIACEVLTSHLSMLSDRLSMDTVQMNRLCDFINREPPLNPLLASYFSKTVEMLLERSPKQDWYLYHIVCLRVLDFFKARRDFLPNLLRHMSTSAIADIFKYFIRVDELFKKTVMEWFEEHQFLESMIQIICGSYVPEELPPASPPPPPPPQPPQPRASPDPPHPPHSPHSPHTSLKDDGSDGDAPPDKPAEAAAPTEESPDSPSSGPGAGSPGPPAHGSPGPGARGSPSADSRAGVASANASALLCDLVLTGCAGEGCTTRPRTSGYLCARLCSGRAAGMLLADMFTCPARMRRHALVHGAKLLLAMLCEEPALARGGSESGRCPEGERSAVELAAAPHLPLLHHALLHDPQDLQEGSSERGSGESGELNKSGRVGAARLQVAALLAHLALSELDEVASTMLTLGTPGVLVELMFQFPHNNFLHAHVTTFLKHALSNTIYRAHYAKHLFIECDLLTKLMDVYEENREPKPGVCRAAYMGHIILCLSRAARALSLSDPLPAAAPLPPAVAARWEVFLQDVLRPLLVQFETPLGGFYPQENIYEVEVMPDTVVNYDYNETGASSNMDELSDDLHNDDGPERAAAQNSFLELASLRFDDENMWDDAPEPEGADTLEAAKDVLAQTSPWASEESSSPGEAGARGEAGAGGSAGRGGGGGGGGEGEGEGWAQFDKFPTTEHFWAYSETQNAESSTEETPQETESSEDKSLSSSSLANNLLSAMSCMSPDAIANIVNANLPRS